MVQKQYTTKAILVPGKVLQDSSLLFSHRYSKVLAYIIGIHIIGIHSIGTTSVEKASNALPQCVCSNDTVYEICALYALMFSHSTHKEPRISYEEYDGCMIVV